MDVGIYCTHIVSIFVCNIVMCACVEVLFEKILATMSRPKSVWAFERKGMRRGVRRAFHTPCSNQLNNNMKPLPRSSRSGQHKCAISVVQNGDDHSQCANRNRFEPRQTKNAVGHEPWHQTVGWLMVVSNHQHQSSVQSKLQAIKMFIDYLNEETFVEQNIWLNRLLFFL